jgi:hypothetical protein
MNKQELVDAARDHLLMSVACTLDISPEAYRSSLDTQTKVKRHRSNIMSLGYNEDFADAVKELMEYRYYGDTLSDEVSEIAIKELRVCMALFPKEIEAYRSLFKSLKNGLLPEIILEHFKTSVPVKEEYRGI